MSTSSNGWSASPDLATRPLVVNGVSFVPGIRDDDDVATVLGYVAQQVNDRVERAQSPGCWGFSFRENRNDPNALSNHASGTAIDFNAPAHPNGIPTDRTWSSEQIGTIHLILAETDDAIRWGGDFNGTPDSMHFEVNTNAANLAVVARKIRNQQEALMPLNADDLAAVRGIVQTELAAFAKNAGDLIKVDMDDNPKTAKWSLERALRWIKGGTA